LPDVVIENPILNSPYDEPLRHFRFGEDGITSDIVDARRLSEYFVPVPRAKKRKQQLTFETEWTKDRIKDAETVNKIRQRIDAWRRGGYADATRTTRQLLEYWQRPERERRLFFCQIEALETAIYIAEVARKYDPWIENHLRDSAKQWNPDLARIAFKMATGSGKTVVMAMLIAWQALNKKANPQDARFSDAFLVVTPGITIKDRLRVLLPNDADNYYRAMDIVTPEQLEQLQGLPIIITNFHALALREKGDGSRLTRLVAGQNATGVAKETPQQMVRRVCRELGNRRNILVINDEAHHCYRQKIEGEADEEETLSGEEKQDAKKRNEQARVWINGLEAVKRKIGVRAVFDLSATPFFLRGSGVAEGTLFPWVVSDFSLIDAIESGIVKVPRVPVADNTGVEALPTYRNLWPIIKDDLSRKGRRTETLDVEPKLPAELEGALRSLYSNYEEAFKQWEENPEARAEWTPPVFIIVCQNTSHSKMLFDWIAGWKKDLTDGGEVVVPGNLELFNNEREGRWRASPRTILVDSAQLDAGEMSPEFKKIAAAEIEEFKQQYRSRTGRDPDDLTDADILREVMNTVGKRDKLGENVRCVVSVSMLTEGWDANTVTHILGVRAFGTQLLCEQVVGRGLRRRSYAVNEEGHFEPEYAEVFGVPFSFIPCAGHATQPKPGRRSIRVRALPERAELEISFPRVVGYRHELSDAPLVAEFDKESRFELSTRYITTWTENAPIVGETVNISLDDLKNRREQEVAFKLAKLVLEKYFRQDGGPEQNGATHHEWDAEVQAWRFPEVLGIASRWLAECVDLKDNTYPQLLLIVEFAHAAAERIYRSIARGDAGQQRLLPVLRPFDTIGTTGHVDFDTVKDTYDTNPAKCQISHVVIDSGWEAVMAGALEQMPEVKAYAKNQGLTFTIPYALNGNEHNYLPDFIVRIDDGRGPKDLLNLIVEVTGEKKKDKEAKAATANALWVPAVNAHGGFGRWAYVEDFDPWNAQNAIRKFLASKAAANA
jgi:type III restriction enzyme